MSYLFINALKNIRSQKKSYLFFSAQILIAFVLMLVFESIASSVSKSLSHTENNPASHTYYFEMRRDDSALSLEERKELQEKTDKYINRTDEIYTEEDLTDDFSYFAVTEDYGFTYEDYQWIKNRFGDEITVSLSACFSRMGVIIDPELDMNRTDGVFPGFKYIRVFFVTDGYFTNNYLNEEIKNFSSEKTAFLPDRYEEMEDTVFTNDVQLSEFLGWLKNKGYKTENILNIKNEYSDRMFFQNCMWYPIYQDTTVPLKDSLILPFDLMEDFNDYFKDKDTMIPSLQTLLTVSFAGDVNPNIIKEISDRLAETHSNKQPLKALYYTPYEIFESYAKGQIQIAGLLNFIASASMIITGVGFIGLIMVIFNNRKKKLAVALVTGATYKELYIETVIEIEAVILSGALLGELFGKIILSIVSGKIDFIPISEDTLTAIFLPVIYASMGILISLTALYKLYKMEPNEILKKE